MRNEPARAQFVGIARRANLGALSRVGPEPLSFFWSNPSRGLHLAALGRVGEGGGDVAWVGSAPVSSPPGPWLGGWAFDAERSWPGFPAERWFLPEVLAWWDGRGSWLAAFGVAGEATEASLNARLDRVVDLGELAAEGLGQRSRESVAGFPLVSLALEEIAAGRLQKVVCARAIEVEGPFVERSVLKALEARNPQCWTFLVRGDDGSAFVGASPETLIEVNGDRVRIDALAGTAARGEGAHLLSDDKELREHDAVVRGIERTLTGLVSELTIPAAPSVKALSNVDHLHTELTATLGPGVRPLDVARRLHPTPAVAGTPTREAVAWLRSHEGFSRGWYAGAVGTLGPSGLTLAVALRSALLHSRGATLFTGAGVVAGSSPEREWVETDRKAETILYALGFGHG